MTTIATASTNHKSVAQIAAEYCLKHPNPEKGDLYRTIDGLNQDLIAMEQEDTRSSLPDADDDDDLQVDELDQ